MDNLVSAKPIIVIDEKRKFTPIDHKPAAKKAPVRADRRRVRIEVDDLEDEDLGYRRAAHPPLRAPVPVRREVVHEFKEEDEPDFASDEERDEWELAELSEESGDEEPLEGHTKIERDEADTDNDYADNLPEGEAELAFWNCLKPLRWTHRTDGVMTIRQVTNWYKGMNGRDRAVFDRMYDHVFTRLFTHLELFFAARNIKDIAEKNKIVSHFVAIGNDNYNSVIDSAELIDYFIGENDCQDFDSMLSEHLQH